MQLNKQFYNSAHHTAKRSFYLLGTATLQILKAGRKREDKTTAGDLHYFKGDDTAVHIFYVNSRVLAGKFAGDLTHSPPGLAPGEGTITTVSQVFCSLKQDTNQRAFCPVKLIFQVQATSRSLV